jgi:hypothetical protein
VSLAISSLSKRVRSLFPPRLQFARGKSPYFKAFRVEGHLQLGFRKVTICLKVKRECHGSRSCFTSLQPGYRSTLDELLRSTTGALKEVSHVHA